MTETETNRALIGEAMAALALGDTKPFGALMHQDFVWSMIGSNSWSGDYRGREAVRRDLFAPLFAAFATPYVNRATNILADGDQVVVECRGEVRTTGGQAYDNTYCYVIRMRDGLMVHLREYMDTQLVADALPVRAA